MIVASSYLHDRLPPRCRLITSSICTWFEGLDCSSFNVVRELGLKRCETVWSLSSAFYFLLLYTLVRKDLVFSTSYLSLDLLRCLF